MYAIRNADQDLHDYDQESLSEALRIEDDPIDEMSHYDIEEDEKSRAISQSDRKHS